jgi:hypothetical protein
MALNSLISFLCRIEPHLRCITEQQRAPFAVELYRLAEEKIGIEESQNFAPQTISDNREAGTQFKRAGEHLANARREVEEAKACLDEDLLECHGEDYGWEELLERIDLALETAANNRKFYTAGIHPDLRTAVEKSLISPNDEVKSYTYPGKGVAKSDYWFLDRAERLLRQCSDEKGEKLDPVDYQNILSNTFVVAFNQFDWNKQRIKTALRRINERPRPNYAAPWAVTPQTKSLK